MTERYADLYETLMKEALGFAEKLFIEQEIPLTDVEDVAAEAALAVLLANRRGAFRSALTRKERRRMQLFRLQCRIRNAARDRLSQKLAVSLSALEGKPEDESTAKLAAELVLATSDNGQCAEEMGLGQSEWFMKFKSAEDSLRRDDTRPRSSELTAAERKAQVQERRDKQDERNEYRRIKKSLDIRTTKPKAIPHERRLKARKRLKGRFTPAHEAYTRELQATKRRFHK